MSRGSIYAGRAVILVTAEDQLNRGLGKVRSTLRKFANTLSNIGDSALRGGLLGSIVSGGILKHFVDFDDKLLTLQAKLGIFGKAVGQDAIVMKELEESIRALGKSTSYTTSQVTEAAIALAQAGFSADKIKGSLQAVLDLGRGTGYGLDQSAEVLANTMATFNLGASAATMVADQLVRATRLGTVEIDDLRESLKYASGAVSNLNEDLPVLLSLLVQMSEAGLKGSLAGTSLNTALNQMVKNAEQLKALYGVDIITGVGSDGKLKIDVMKSFINIAKQLQAIPDPGKRLAAYNDIFNLRGARAVTSVREMDQVVKILEKLTDASGEARKAAQTMDMRLGGSLRRATGAISDFVLTLGQINAPLATSFLEAIPAAAQALQYFAKAHGDLMVTLVLAPFALVAVGLALKGLAVSMAIAASSLTPLISGMRALSRIVLPGTGRQLAFLMGTKKSPSIFKQGASAFSVIRRSNAESALKQRMKRQSNYLRLLGGMQVASGMPGLASKGAKNIFRSENLAKSISSMKPHLLFNTAKAFFSLGNSIRRFVFSAGGITTVLELLLIFGDKLPGVKDAMQAFSNGFKAAGEQIGKIRGMLGPGMALFSQGIETLNAGEVEAGLSLLQTGVHSLIGVIGNQLSAAWFAFMEKVSWVYDIFKKIVLVSYEIGAAIAGSIGIALNNIVGRFGRLFGGEAGSAGDWGMAFLATAAKILAGVVPAFLAGILKFESILAQFILDLQDAFPLLATGGSKDRLRNTILSNEAGVAALLNTMFNSFKKIDEVMGGQTKTDFARRRVDAEAAAKAAKDVLLNTNFSAMLSSYFSNLMNGLSNMLGSITSSKAAIVDPFLDDMFAGFDKMRKADNGPANKSVPDLAKALEIISSFVGSAQASRGNLLQAINVEKANQEAIKDNTKRAADELEDINARGGQLVFTS